MVQKPHQERLTRLSAGVRMAKRVYEDAQEARDAAIEEADLDNVPLLRMVRWTKLSRSHLDKVILRRTAARQTAALKAMQLAPGPVDS